MTKGELSLLLYLESRAVNQGHVDTRHMNKEDMRIAERWINEGFIQFGRIASEYLMPKDMKRGRGTHWVRLSDEAWEVACKERKTRANRIWEKRNWLTTDEKRQNG